MMAVQTSPWPLCQRITPLCRPIRKERSPRLEPDNQRSLSATCRAIVSEPQGTSEPIEVRHRTTPASLLNKPCVADMMGSICHYETFHVETESQTWGYIFVSNFDEHSAAGRRSEVVR